MEVGEALLLGLAQQFAVEHIDVSTLFERCVSPVDVKQLVQEPAVDFGQFVDLVDGVSGEESLFDDEDALVGGRFEGGFDVVDFQLLVAHKAVHALSNHAQSLLNGLFKSAPDGHHFAHGFHRTTQFAVDSAELAQVPAWDFADHIVECRFEEGGSRLGHRVLQVEEPVAQTQLCRHKCEGIARRFGSQGRTPAQTCVDLDDAIVLAFGVESILHVALAHDADMTHDADGQFTQFVIFAVGEGLGGGDDNRFTSVDAEWVEVFHVAHGDAVVETVAHHFVFHLFPALQTFLNEDLGREGEGFFGQVGELFLVVAKSGAETAKRVGRADDDGIAQSFGRPTCVLDVFHRLALDGLDADFIQLLDKQLAVFRVHNGLYRCAEDGEIVAFQRTAAIEFDPTVERRLPPKGKHNTLGSFFLNNTLYEVGCNRKEIDLVSNPFRGLYSCNIGIDENGLNTFFFKSFKGLAT